MAAPNYAYRPADNSVTTYDGDLPAGHVQATPEQVQAYTGEVAAQHEYSSPVQVAAGLGEAALAAGTLGAYKPDPTRDRIVREQHPLLHGAAQALPAAALEAATGGVGGILAGAAYGGIGSESADAQAADREFSLKRAAALSLVGAAVGVGGALLSRGLSRGAGALADTIESRVAADRVAARAAQVGEDEVVAAAKSGAKASAEVAPDVLERAAARLERESAASGATLDRELSQALPKPPRNLEPVSLSARESVLSALSKLPVETAPELAARAAEAPTVGKMVSHLSALADEFRSGGQHDAADAVSKMLRDPAVSGESARHAIARDELVAATGRAEKLAALERTGLVEPPRLERLRAAVNSDAEAASRVADVRAAAETSRQSAAAAAQSKARFDAALNGASTVADVAGALHVGIPLGSGLRAVVSASAALGRRADIAAKALVLGGRAARAVEASAQSVGRAAAAAGRAAAYAQDDAPEREFERQYGSVQTGARAVVEAVQANRADPAAMFSRLASEHASLPPDSPELAAVVESHTRAAEFIMKHVPATAAPSFRRPDGLPPSKTDALRVARIVTAFQRPEVVLGRMGSGTCTVTEARALEAAYPDLFERMRGNVLRELAAFPGRVDTVQSARLETWFRVAGASGAQNSPQTGALVDASREETAQQGTRLPTVSAGVGQDRLSSTVSNAAR